MAASLCRVNGIEIERSLLTGCERGAAGHHFVSKLRLEIFAVGFVVADLT